MSIKKQYLKIVFHLLADYISERKNTQIDSAKNMDV